MATIRLMDEVECPTSSEVHAWLRAHGWTPIPSPHPAWLRWALGNRYTEVPADDTFDDWPRRVAEACDELGAHHQQSAASVAREMARERVLARACEAGT